MSQPPVLPSPPVRTPAQSPVPSPDQSPTQQSPVPSPVEPPAQESPEQAVQQPAQQSSAVPPRHSKRKRNFFPKKQWAKRFQKPQKARRKEDGTFEGLTSSESDE